MNNTILTQPARTPRQEIPGQAATHSRKKQVSNDNIIICGCLISNGQDFGFVLGGVRV